MRQHHHSEAFCLMTYTADDGSETERSDAVAAVPDPFVITLRSGKQATHKNWRADEYAPWHQPELGERMFVDITEERAREHATRNAAHFWNENVAQARMNYKSVEDLADQLTTAYFQQGAPDLIEVAG